jgi:hypothetical protein
LIFFSKLSSSGKQLDAGQHMEQQRSPASPDMTTSSTASQAPTQQNNSSTYVYYKERVTDCQALPFNPYKPALPIDLLEHNRHKRHTTRQGHTQRLTSNTRQSSSEAMFQSLPSTHLRQNSCLLQSPQPVSGDHNTYPTITLLMRKTISSPAAGVASAR